MVDAVRVEEVYKSFGSIRALKGVSLSVRDGEYICILGPTGAGKTTLLRIIAGLLRPDSGRVYVHGEDCTDVPAELRGVGYMPQGFALFPHLTVWENVSYSPWIKGLDTEPARKALELVNLADRASSYPSELSGGQRQRIALARVLASGSRVLLLDEPLSALDAILNIELRYELRGMAKRLNLTTIHVTHDTSVALSIADRVVLLNGGRIVQEGTPHGVYDLPGDLFTAMFLGEMNLIEGWISGARAGMFAVRTRGLGTLYVRRDRSFAKSGDVIVAYRPCDLEVAAFPVSDDNVVRFTLEEIEFLGIITRLHLKRNDVRMLADCWTSTSENVARGMKIYVRFPPERGIIYPRSPELVLEGLRGRELYA